MKFEMKSSGVPVGSYKASFVGAEEFNENVEKFGAGVLLKWKVIGGQHDGAEATRICSAKLSPKSNLGKFVVALNGGAVEAGQAVDLDDYIGVSGSVIVEETDSGSTRVSTFLADAK